MATPRLAENLRALASVRDLVAGLPREVPIDVAPEVMARIRTLSRPRHRPVWSRPAPVWVRGLALGAGSFSVAASISLMLAVLFARPGNLGREAAADKPIDNVIALVDPKDSAPAPVDDDVSIAVGPPSSAARSGQIDAQATLASALASNRDAEAISFGASSTPEDLKKARKMLDVPAERRLFFIQSGRDGKAQQTVASVVERTSRFNFFEITISHGIVIDPRHPDEATVLALLVSPKELGRLRNQLRDALPDAVEESPVEPGVVTQLADLRDVQQFAPVPMADSSVPGGILARRTEVPNSGGEALSPAALKARRRPTPEQERSAPLPASVARSSAAHEPDSGAEVVVLDNRSRTFDGAAAGPPSSSDPLAQAKLAAPRPEPAASSLDAASRDEKILVFVWVCKSRPS